MIKLLLFLRVYLLVLWLGKELYVDQKNFNKSMEEKR